MTAADAADSPSVEELLPAYALGATDPPDRRRVERALAEAATGRLVGELVVWRGVVAAIAEAPAPVVPAATTRRRTLHRLPPRSTQPRRSAVGGLLAAAALVALVAGAVLWQRGAVAAAAARRAATVAADERAALREELVRARRELAGARGALGVLERVATAPRLATVTLANLSPVAPGGEVSIGGRTFLDPAGGRALFLAHGLAPLPAERVYQLWWIAAGEPRSAGTFTVDAAGRAWVVVEPVAAAPADRWAVTVEPAGGVAAPTGAMVLAS